MKKNIAIACGGYSEEHEISIKSGKQVFKEINRALFRPFLVQILEGEWSVVDETGKKTPVDRADFSVVWENQKIKFDAVFNCIHGTPGEDGLFQAYLELLHIPQTSSDHYPAALSFNKRDCINVLKHHGISSAKNYVLNKGDTIDEEAIVGKVGLPCFVKANRAGSSFGISKVKEKSALQKAIEYSYTFDHEVIIESALEGTEVSVSVINFNGELRVLPLTELVSENEFFDYDAKYLGQSQEITPARISAEAKNRVEERAKKIAQILKLKGLSRSEFIFVDNEPYFLETNTVPGLTEASIVPQQIKSAGLQFSEVITQMIDHALELDQSK